MRAIAAGEKTLLLVSALALLSLTASLLTELKIQTMALVTDKRKAVLHVIRIALLRLTGIYRTTLLLSILFLPFLPASRDTVAEILRRALLAAGKSRRRRIVVGFVNVQPLLFPQMLPVLGQCVNPRVCKRLVGILPQLHRLPN